MGLWKACGIENLFPAFLPAITAQFLFGTAFLAFKCMNSNQLYNSRGINMGIGQASPKSAYLGDLHISRNRTLDHSAVLARYRALDLEDLLEAVSQRETKASYRFIGCGLTTRQGLSHCLADFQDSEKSFLRDIDSADSLHEFLAFPARPWSRFSSRLSEPASHHFRRSLVLG